jgi:hypothetical protein
MGRSVIGTSMITHGDLPTRIETYERHRVKSGLTQLPSGHKDFLMMTL